MPYVWLFSFILAMMSTQATSSVMCAEALHGDSDDDMDMVGYQDISI